MSDDQKLAERVVNLMLEKDAFSKWCGMAVLEITPRRAVVQMRVREEMTNGFGVSHGGIVYSLADSALAFAANTHGKITVAIENAISYPKAVRPGDLITATCEEESSSNRLGFYRVVVKNQNDEIVSTLRGTVYRTAKEFEGLNVSGFQDRT